MGSFVAKQPNGLYCRFSSVLDWPSHWNMTREDYIEYCMRKAKEEAIEVLDYALNFDMVTSCYIPNNMVKKEFKEFLKDVNTPIEMVVEMKHL